MNTQNEITVTGAKQELVDDEQRLTAYDEDPQKVTGELGMYEDEASVMSGSAESEDSDMEDLEEGSELQKELLSRTDRDPLGQLQPHDGEGMVMCEFCGKLGVRDAFYSKTKRFCSVSCSKSFSSGQKDVKHHRQTAASNHQLPSKSLFKSNFISNNGIKFGSDLNRTFDWSNYMNQLNALAAPVSCFKHCLMADSWDNIAVGMKVEVINTDCEVHGRAYWIATVIQLTGYRAQLRYEGFGNDATLDFWINLCAKDIHPVGWCAANKKPLVPPKSIQHKYLDWKDFLVKRLTGARTLPQNFYCEIKQNLQNTTIKKSMFVEVVDKLCVSAMRVAKVDDVIGGRLKLLYVDSEVENDEFWCHEESPLVHPVGWSQLVGHKLNASQEYKTESLNKAVSRKYSENDCTPQMFSKKKDLPHGMKFQVGMKLEAIDPLNLSSICVATVKKVLRNNYVMIGIDGSSATNGSDWFCYHATSPCIFPVGFCEISKIPLTPPRGFVRGQFKWFDYLTQTKSVAAPVKLFDKDIPRHGFKVGMKLEAVDLMEPRLICVATVKQVVGRLLRIHFDGWEMTYDQWVDCNSVDIYPVGWCEMVGYPLQGPRPREPVKQHLVIHKKRKSKSQMYRGPRKKRKHPKTSGPGRQQLDSDISRDSFSTGVSEPITSSNNLSVSIIPKQEISPRENPESINIEADAKTASDVAQRVSNTSNLASSMPSIANMLNSPAKQAPVLSSTQMQLSSSANSEPSNPASPKPTCVILQSVYGSPVPMSPSSGSLIHYIPRVIPGEPDPDCIKQTSTLSSDITPAKWSVSEVCYFLSLNDCAAHCDSFRKKSIGGEEFLSLTKEQIVNLTGMKVGPSLKIFDIIQALKLKVSQSSAEVSESGTIQVTASALLQQQSNLQAGSSSTSTQPGIVRSQNPITTHASQQTLQAN